MPDCIYRFSAADKSICLIEPPHVGPCLVKACCVALSHDLSPQFKPAMRGKLKFWVQTKDPKVLQDSRLQLLKNYPHLGLAEVCALEEDIVKIILEKGAEILHVSKAIPFHTL